MTFLDTSVLVEAAAVDSVSTVPMRLRELMASGERIAVPAIVHYEFLRGPRTPSELAFQTELFPPEHAVAFGFAEAQVSAKLYRSVTRARGRETDLAIAACALVYHATLWTLNVKDFSDIPGLRLAREPGVIGWRKKVAGP